jgi:hypothetical protein
MLPVTRTKVPTVNKQGAVAGCVLRGSSPGNQGLRLRVLEEQLRGHDGPITGRFVILGVGDNRHSDSLAALLNGATDALEVVALIRREHAACVSVVNRNILVVEEN